jgi:predicted Zn-dependent peptidase
MLLEPLESPAGLANALASGQLLLGDPNDWRRRIDQLDALTPDDLRRVAGRFLNAPHRYVVQTARDTTGGAR